METAPCGATREATRAAGALRRSRGDSRHTRTRATSVHGRTASPSDIPGCTVYGGAHSVINLILKPVDEISAVI